MLIVNIDSLQGLITQRLHTIIVWRVFYSRGEHRCSEELATLDVNTRALEEFTTLDVNTSAP